MSGITGAVYDPPRAGLPYIAVVFDPKGDVLISRAVPSAEAGHNLIAKTFNEFAKKTGTQVKEI